MDMANKPGSQKALEETMRRQSEASAIKKEEESSKKETRKAILSYIADKWIDLLALVVASIALIRTFL